jgi:hypothetical protein
MYRGTARTGLQTARPWRALSQPCCILKAELWQHIEEKIRGKPQEILKLIHTPDSQASQIVDIQFAMSNYKFLDQVVKIKKATQRI